MEVAAGQSSRVENPVYHLSISFDAADDPTCEQMREAAERVLDRLGLNEHQALLVAHNDTNHPHVHIMVNRVHRTSFERELARTYRDPESARAAFEKLAAKEGIGPATEKMLRVPEAFGDLQETQKRTWLGLTRQQIP